VVRRWKAAPSGACLSKRFPDLAAEWLASVARTTRVLRRRMLRRIVELTALLFEAGGTFTMSLGAVVAR
jgi:hypothetical protein